MDALPPIPTVFPRCDRALPRDERVEALADQYAQLHGRHLDALLQAIPADLPQERYDESMDAMMLGLAFVMGAIMARLMAPEDHQEGLHQLDAALRQGLQATLASPLD